MDFKLLRDTKIFFFCLNSKLIGFPGALGPAFGTCICRGTLRTHGNCFYNASKTWLLPLLAVLASLKFPCQLWANSAPLRFFMLDVKCCRNHCSQFKNSIVNSTYSWLLLAQLRVDGNQKSAFQNQCGRSSHQCIIIDSRAFTLLPLRLSS